MQRLLIAVALIALATATLFGHLADEFYQENKRLENNCLALTEDVQLYRTKADESAASVQALEMRLDEFRQQRQADMERIKELGIKLHRVESFARSVTEQRVEESVVLRDTVILRDTVRIFEGGDNWTSIRGTIADDTLHYSLRSVDTLHQVVHRVPRKWWIFRFGTRAIRQEITSSNPHTELVYAEYIELGKRRHNKMR